MILVYLNQIYATVGAFRAVREHYKRKRLNAIGSSREDPNDLSPAKVSFVVKGVIDSNDPLKDPLSSELRSRLKYFVLASSLYAWEGSFEWLLVWFPFYTTIKFLVCVLMITRHAQVFDVLFAPTMRDALRMLSASDELVGRVMAAYGKTSEAILLEAHATPVRTLTKRPAIVTPPSIVTPKAKERSVKDMILSLHDDEDDDVAESRASYKEQLSTIEDSLDSLAKKFRLPDFSFKSDEEEELEITVEMGDDDEEESFEASPLVTIRATPIRRLFRRFSSSSKKRSVASLDDDDSFDDSPVVSRRDAVREARIEQLLNESNNSKRSNSSPRMRLRSGRSVGR